MRRRLARLSILLALVMIAPMGPAPAVPVCPAMDPALATDVTFWNSLNETSGIQSSLDHLGVLWAIEDSGNGPYLYAFDLAGTRLATYTLTGWGLRNIDWEAIGLDPREGPDLLYIGDIGDNRATRDGTERPKPALYVLPEPTVSTTQEPVVATISGVKKYAFRYFDGSASVELGPRDAEAMFVDPRTDNIFIVQKDVRTIDGVDKMVRVFEIRDRELVSGETNKAINVASIVGAGDGVGTGPVSADIAFDGEWIAIKNYAEGFIWRRARKQSIAQVLTAQPIAPCRFDVDGSESVAFGYSPSGVWTKMLSLKEDKAGNPPLRILERAWV